MTQILPNQLRQPGTGATGPNQIPYVVAEPWTPGVNRGGAFPPPAPLPDFPRSPEGPSGNTSWFESSNPLSAHSSSERALGRHGEPTITQACSVGATMLRAQGEPVIVESEPPELPAPDFATLTSLALVGDHFPKLPDGQPASAGRELVPFAAPTAAPEASATPDPGDPNLSSWQRMVQRAIIGDAETQALVWQQYRIFTELHTSGVFGHEPPQPPPFPDPRLATARGQAAVPVQPEWTVENVTLHGMPVDPELLKYVSVRAVASQVVSARRNLAMHDRGDTAEYARLTGVLATAENNLQTRIANAYAFPDQLGPKITDEFDADLEPAPHTGAADTSTADTLRLLEGLRKW